MKDFATPNKGDTVNAFQYKVTMIMVNAFNIRDYGKCIKHQHNIVAICSFNEEKKFKTHT